MFVPSHCYKRIFNANKPDIRNTLGIDEIHSTSEEVSPTNKMNDHRAVKEDGQNTYVENSSNRMRKVKHCK